MRVKVAHLLPTSRDNPDYAAFKTYIHNTSIVHGLDNELEVNDNLATEMATQLRMEALTETAAPDTGSIQTLRYYMNLLAASAPVFLYSIANDDAGLTNGISWTTGTMRYNFETYDG